jgi:hypothetical protein
VVLQLHLQSLHNPCCSIVLVALLLLAHVLWGRAVLYTASRMLLLLLLWVDTYARCAYVVPSGIIHYIPNVNTCM